MLCYLEKVVFCLQMEAIKSKSNMKTEKQYFAFNKSTGLWWDGKFGFNSKSRDVDGGKQKYHNLPSRL